MNSFRLTVSIPSLSVSLALFLALSLTALAAGDSPPLTSSNWPSFRGVGATGVSDAAGLPADWDIESGRNILWTLDLPGVSHSSPVVWGDQVFVISAVSDRLGDSGRDPSAGSDPVADSGEFDWRLYSVDRNSGEISWSVSAHQGRPRTNRHEKSSQSNATPSTDGRHVVAIFGSEGLFCFDMSGDLLWRADLGVLDTGLYGDATSNWGYAASPTIHDDRVFVQVDRHTDSFIAAYRLEDGAEIWRTARSEKNTWSTPTLYEHEGHSVLVANGGNYIRAYDPANGDEIWRFADDAQVKVPTPFFADGKVILSGGYPQGRAMYAFDPGSRGDVSGPDAGALVWRVPQGGPYTATPVAVDGYLYSVTDQGILSVYDLETGDRMYRERLSGGFSASPVAADGKVYLPSEDGDLYTVAVGPEFELLARIDMGEPLFATPALLDGMIIVRSWSRLYGIAGDS